MSRLVRTAGAIATAGAACVAYGTLVERHWYRLARTELPGALHGGGEPLRILQVGDVHLDPPDRPLETFVRSLADIPCDLVVLSGDLLGAPGVEDRCAQLLGTLTAGGTPGVAVLGSNDAFGPTRKNPLRYFLDPDARTYGVPLDTSRFQRELEAHGYRVLRDATTVLDTRAGRVAVAGIDDPHLQDPKAGPLELPSAAALAVADDQARLRLGLVHAPYTAALDRLVEAGYDVLLAAHTHGGQVRFPPFGAVVANCDLPLDRVRGASRWGDAWLHVSAGLGESRYAPFRFACRPEANLLTLTS